MNFVKYLSKTNCISHLPSRFHNFSRQYIRLHHSPSIIVVDTIIKFVAGRPRLTHKAAKSHLQQDFTISHPIFISWILWVSARPSTRLYTYEKYLQHVRNAASNYDALLRRPGGISMTEVLILPFAMTVFHYARTTTTCIFY